MEAMAIGLVVVSPALAVMLVALADLLWEMIMSGAPRTKSAEGEP